MKRRVAGIAGMATLLFAQACLAEDRPGGSVNLDLSLVVEQETCEMSLMTPDTMNFVPLRASDLKEAGVIARVAAKTISLNLSGCENSAISGQTPAIQISGNTPVSGEETLFRDDSSTSEGAIGFRVRYQPDTGAPGDALKNQQMVDLAGSGQAVSNGMQNFLVDMQYAGGAYTSGSIRATLRFTFMYH
ncbi:fimbrial protein [Lelliottia nimipressuralis]|uniref:fimbrial protein n=1 Tax=Lelliottia nimipressuralis TaxID=69220 RepID=UPI0035561295